MFGYPTIPRASPEVFSDSLTAPDVLTSSPLIFPTLCPVTAELFESVTEAFHSGSSSGSYNSPSSLTSCCTTTTQRRSLMQRSVSSHSLKIQKNGFHNCHLATSLNESIDSDSVPVRRVFSTGDLDQ
ncbi:hypothetical protein Gohar_015105, partial [Gossypium harknessii]|nr:hypothetical protein [Gossypium harknessii]